MKRVLLLGSALCFLLLTSFRPIGEWVVFASEVGHYAITLPDNPTGEYLIENEIHMLTYSQPGEGVYLLAWRDMHAYFPAERNIRKLLKEGMDDAAASMGTTSLEVLHTEIGATSYIEFTFRTKGYLGKGRIYIINEFQYSLLTTGPLQEGVTPGMDRFLNSFRYLP